MQESTSGSEIPDAYPLSGPASPGQQTQSTNSLPKQASASDGLTTGTVRALSTYRLDGRIFNVALTTHKDLDVTDDMRDVMSFYRSELIDSGEPKRNLSDFDRKVISTNRFTKAQLTGYFNTLMHHAIIGQSLVASHIPQQQSHLLEALGHKEVTLELQLHRLYFENDFEDGKPRRTLRRRELESYHAEEALYIDPDSEGTHAIVQIDLSYMLRHVVRPAFLARTRSLASLDDFCRDNAHELAHFSRFVPFMRDLYAFESAFYDGDKEAKGARMRDFLVQDISRLIVEEGIANYGVYSDDPFHLHAGIPGKFWRKVRHLLRVSDPERYMEDNISVDTRKDGAGTYYVGEASCYLIALLLGERKGASAVTMEHAGSRIQARDLPRILSAQRFDPTTPAILLSQTYDQYLPVWKHIRQLSPDQFYAQVRESQDHLAIPEESRIVSERTLARLLERAKGVPFDKKTPLVSAQTAETTGPISNPSAPSAQAFSDSVSSVGRRNPHTL